jgi:uncharacterized protein YutE (UPF0331/DUF86 family)
MDLQRIYAKIDEIEQYLGEIEEIMPLSAEEYAGSLEKRRALERLLQITIEAVMDTSAILVKDLKLGLPSGEDDFLGKLQGNILDQEMVDRIRKMKGFRNVLVHGYAQIDDEKVFRILSQDLQDIREFKVAVIEFVRES